MAYNTIPIIWLKCTSYNESQKQDILLMSITLRNIDRRNSYTARTLEPAENLLQNTHFIFHHSLTRFLKNRYVWKYT